MRPLVCTCFLLASTVASASPADRTLSRDVGRVASYLGKRGKPFASVYVVGWTADRGLVYRTSVCDENLFGDRGPFCQIDVCTAAAGAEPDCESIVDVEQGTTIDRKDSVAAVETAEAARAVTDAGTRASAKLDRAHDDIWIEAMEPAAARVDHRKPWRRARYEKEISDRGLVVTAVRATKDGTCTALAGTGVTWQPNPDRATYGNWSVARDPFAFAVVRCK